MRYAVIENNIVVNAIELDPSELQPLYGPVYRTVEVVVPREVTDPETGVVTTVNDVVDRIEATGEQTLVRPAFELPGMILTQTDEASPGWTYDGTSFIAPPPPPPHEPAP